MFLQNYALDTIKSNATITLSLWAVIIERSEAQIGDFKNLVLTI